MEAIIRHNGKFCSWDCNFLQLDEVEPPVCRLFWRLEATHDGVMRHPECLRRAAPIEDEEETE